MPKKSSMTSKGQVTIPVSIRLKWALQPRDQVVFTVVEDRVELKPASDFFAMKGSLPQKEPFSDKKADLATEKYFQNEKTNAD